MNEASPDPARPQAPEDTIRPRKLEFSEVIETLQPEGHSIFNKVILLSITSFPKDPFHLEVFLYPSALKVHKALSHKGGWPKGLARGGLPRKPEPHNARIQKSGGGGIEGRP